MVMMLTTAVHLCGRESALTSLPRTKECKKDTKQSRWVSSGRRAADFTNLL